MSDAKTRIDETVKANDVVLYMKGTKEMPQCGFSSRVAGVLNYMGVDYADVNVLADEEIRQGIKEFSDWPTIPQLYVKGEFVGGCDIITEMTLSGELDTLLARNGHPVMPIRHEICLAHLVDADGRETTGRKGLFHLLPPGPDPFGTRKEIPVEDP